MASFSIKIGTFDRKKLIFWGAWQTPIFNLPDHFTPKMGEVTIFTFLGTKLLKTCYF